jgi:hypothetical protein
VRLFQGRLCGVDCLRFVLESSEISDDVAQSMHEVDELIDELVKSTFDSVETGCDFRHFGRHLPAFEQAFEASEAGVEIVGFGGHRL